MREPVFNETVRLGIVVRVLKLDEYAPRQPRRPDELQQDLFSDTEAI